MSMLWRGSCVCSLARMWPRACLRNNGVLVCMCCHPLLCMRLLVTPSWSVKRGRAGVACMLHVRAQAPKHLRYLHFVLPAVVPATCMPSPPAALHTALLAGSAVEVVAMP
jgi:hypothetical protein